MKKLNSWNTMDSEKGFELCPNILSQNLHINLTAVATFHSSKSAGWTSLCLGVLY